MSLAAAPITGAACDRGSRVASRGQLLAALALAWSATVGAGGYEFVPPDAETLRDPVRSGVMYFGSVRDERGQYVPGVTVTLDAGNTSFVAVTNFMGRYRIRFIPMEIDPKQIQLQCSKADYVQVQLVKRPPLSKTISPIQADCVLRRAV